MAPKNTSPVLGFQLTNSQERNTVYVEDRTSLNTSTLDAAVGRELKFKLTNRTSEAISLQPGRPIPKSQADSTSGSLVYLDLTELNISEGHFKNIVCKAEGWNSSVYPSDNLLCFSPKQAIKLDQDYSIDLQLAGIDTARYPAGSNANLHVSGHNIPSAISGGAPFSYSFKVLFQNSPGPGKKDLTKDLQCEISSAHSNNIIRGNQVKNNPPAQNWTAPANTFNLVFSPKSGNPSTVKAGSDTQFTISFVCASDDKSQNALTTSTCADTIKVTNGTNAANWTVNNPSKSSQNPQWTLQPPSGAAIVDTTPGSSESTVEFVINNVKTTSQPGATIMYVQYKNVPGYRDGSYYLPLEKVQPPPGVIDLSVSPSSYTAYYDPYSYGKDKSNNVFLKYHVYAGGDGTHTQHVKDFTLNIQKKVNGTLQQMPGYPKMSPNGNLNGNQPMDPNLPPGEYKATLTAHYLDNT